MRCAVLTTSYPLYPGQAAGHFVEAEVLSARRAGDEVVVIAPGPRAFSDPAAGTFRIPSAGLFGPPGALPRLRQNPLRALGLLSFGIQARRLLQRLGPFDELVAHWLLPCAWPIASGQPSRLEAVAHGSDVRLLSTLPRALRLRIARELLRDVTRVRCVSESVRDALIEATSPELGARTVVAASPIELPRGLDRIVARRRLRLDPRARFVVIVARLIPEKRVATALRALAQLPGVGVVVVGGGPQLESLRRAFPGVRFTGELPRPATLDWIAAADALLSTSKLEGAPTVVREARGLGTPVIACAAGSLERVAEQDSGVWLVPASGIA